MSSKEDHRVWGEKYGLEMHYKALEDAFRQGFQYGIASDLDKDEAWEDCLKKGFERAQEAE